jgi:hypothetical protein
MQTLDKESRARLDRFLEMTAKRVPERTLMSGDPPSDEFRTPEFKNPNLACERTMEPSRAAGDRLCLPISAYRGLHDHLGGAGDR